MMEKRYFKIADAAIETAEGESSAHLRGYASVYDANSLRMDHSQYGEFVERVSPTAFNRSLRAAHAGDVNIYALWSHDQSQPLGSVRGGKLTLQSDERGLGFTLDTSRFTPAQLDAARDGELQMSFGFNVREEAWEFPVNGPAIRSLIDVDLFEISPVISPAYPDTSAAVRALGEWEARQAHEIDQAMISADVESLRVRLLKRWADQIMAQRGLQQRDDK